MVRANKIVEPKPSAILGQDVIGIFGKEFQTAGGTKPIFLYFFKIILQKYTTI
jgi:hypothetical protein